MVICFGHSPKSPKTLFTIFIVLIGILLVKPSQGYHRYYLVPKEYREHIRSCTPLADVLIEVLGTGRFVTFGDGYNLLQFDVLCACNRIIYVSFKKLYKAFYIIISIIIV